MTSVPRPRAASAVGGFLLTSVTVVSVTVVALALPAGAHAANPTKLSLNCAPGQLSPGKAAVCTATVTDSGSVASRQPPAGTVVLTIEGVGELDPADGCALEPSGAFSSKCTVSYTPTAIAGGEHEVLGTYNGDPQHGRATARLTLDVGPANDDPDTAIQLKIPAKATGSTEGATWEFEDPDLCSDAYAPVWYSVKPTQSGRLAVRLTVRGRVDSVVAVFRLDRSKQKPLGCALTDASGVAAVSYDAEKGGTYLIAVAAPWDAREGGFTLETANVAPVALPGQRLTGDADTTLDPLLRPGIAFSLHLRRGVTYRINATAAGACLGLALLRPAARSAGDVVRKTAKCDGYLVYSPEPGLSGLFPLVVSVPAGRAVHVHVAVRTVGADDLAPGLALSNGHLRHGALAALQADVVDVYRFRVTQRTNATIGVRGRVPSDLLLLNGSGKLLSCGCEGSTHSTVVHGLAPGGYFAVVRGRPGASGSYTVSLRLRRPTSTSVHAITGARGGPSPIVARVSPPATGRVIFEVERFDPLTGWHFHHAVRRRVDAGRARASLAPASGRWRIRARYAGSLSASPSTSGWALVVRDV